MKIKNFKLKIESYNPSEIEKKWQKVWEENKIYSPDLDKAKKPFYNLMMFPYPSAEGMHVGNMYAFTGADVYGRFMRMQGYDVFEPIGLDGFGIHSENYAIKVGKHPVEQAKISEANFYRQLRAIGNGFDWSRTVETYKPEYYKWTQWLFIQLFKAGLAYRKKAPVNFCPSCKTVLADEQVVQKVKSQNNVILGSEATPESKTDSGQARMTIEVSVCERCESEVVKKDLEQWFFKITKYSDRLLDNLNKIDWVEKVKIAQRQWIGRSEGARIRFNVILSEKKDLKNKRDSSAAPQNDSVGIEVFTTRPDTLFGATFLVLSPEHPIVVSLLKGEIEATRSLLAKLKSYVEESRKRTEQERVAEGKEKTGVSSGLYAINPVNNEKIPIWIADYVLMGYGTGAIMAVPAHDQRDFEFAKKYSLAIKTVILGTSETRTPESKTDSGQARMTKADVGEGIIINSNEWNDWQTPDSIGKVIDWLEKKSLGRKKSNYHLRDWLISRQRYWGPPIPMIYCKKCDWQAVPEKDLPVKLPFIKDYKPLGTGKSPLEGHPEFYKTKCPNCGKDAKRETDVSDTFLDSAWYFLRYVSTDIDDNALDIERVKKWLPVNMYIGGAEHSVLHLLYSRFITMALNDLGIISFEEPFARFYANGLLVKDGAKMSKSKGNVIVPDAYIKKYGADTLRTYLMFMGPFNMGGDFRDSGIEGMSRFLRRMWTLVQNVILSEIKDLDSSASPQNDMGRKRMMNKTIKKVTEDIQNLRYNTAISCLMEYYNFLSNQKEVSKEEAETLVLLLAPFAPHISEKLYQLLKNNKDFSSIHKSQWPKYDPKHLEVSEMTVVVQVNGKLRGDIRINSETAKQQKEVEDLARKIEKISKYLQDKKIKKIIYVEGKVLNFVID